MTQQLASDIHHYDQRLTAALSNLENDKNVLEANRKKIGDGYVKVSTIVYVLAI